MSDRDASSNQEDVNEEDIMLEQAAKDLLDVASRTSETDLRT